MTPETVPNDRFSAWLTELSRRLGGRALSAPTAQQMTAYSVATRSLARPYTVAEALRAVDPPAERHSLRRVIKGSRWDARGLLLEAARQAIAGRAPDVLAFGATTAEHGEHGDTVLDLAAIVGEDVIPIGWRRLRDDAMRNEAREGAELVTDALAALGLRRPGVVAPPVICPDLLGDERLRALLATARLEYAVAMPHDYVGAALSVDPGTFWRRTSVLGHDLRDAARSQPVRLRDRPGSHVLDAGAEWVVGDTDAAVPTCWVVHPVLRGADAAPPLRASREQARAVDLAELRRVVPPGRRAEALGVALFSFDDDAGWERDAVLRSLRLIFEQIHA